MKCFADICSNRQYLIKKLIPNYAKIKIQYISPAKKFTQQGADDCMVLSYFDGMKPEWGLVLRRGNVPECLVVNRIVVKTSTI